MLSFANPQALKIIYGLNKGLVKVKFQNISRIKVIDQLKVRILSSTVGFCWNNRSTSSGIVTVHANECKSVNYSKR